jgi:hypothetical protein
MLCGEEAGLPGGVGHRDDGGGHGFWFNKGLERTVVGVMRKKSEWMRYLDVGDDERSKRQGQCPMRQEWVFVIHSRHKTANKEEEEEKRRSANQSDWSNFPSQKQTKTPKSLFIFIHPHSSREYN